MDLATLFGLLLAWGAVVVSALMEGGHLAGFLNMSALVLIVGATMGAAMLASPLSAIIQLPRFALASLMQPSLNPAGRMRELVALSHKARREGLLALEDEAASHPEPFMKKGLQWIVDGAEPELIRGLLQNEITLWEQKESQGEALFSTLGGYAPTVGIIGTVLGLIHALGKIDEPKKMGGAIASAFLATFYGVAFANLLFLPISSKLKARLDEKLVIHEMTLEGLLAIQSGENPRLIQEKLSTFLPEGTRTGSAEVLAEADVAA